VSVPAEWLQLVSQWRVYSEAAVFREELQSCRLVLKANESCGIGRQETNEDTVRRLGKCYGEL
jgi:hypothetical protein